MKKLFYLSLLFILAATFTLNAQSEGQNIVNQSNGLDLCVVSGTDTINAVMIVDVFSGTVRQIKFFDLQPTPVELTAVTYEDVVPCPNSVQDVNIFYQDTIPTIHKVSGTVTDTTKVISYDRCLLRAADTLEVSVHISEHTGEIVRVLDCNDLTEITVLASETLEKCIDTTTVEVVEEKRRIVYVRIDANQAGTSTLYEAVTSGGTAGVIGNTFTLDFDFKSFSIQWLRDTALDGQLDVNQRRYLAGPKVGTAGYVEQLPYALSYNDEVYTEDYVFTATSGGVLEIQIELEQ